MRFSLTALLLVLPASVAAQAAGKFPPDSLVNTKVIPHGTPVIQVIGTMRNFAFGLGVRCQFCHVGEEGQPLSQFDFPSDQKRTKQVARQMMRMVEEINLRLDTLPGRTNPGLRVTCETCHRGVNRPEPLSEVLVDATAAGGADSATKAYQALRQRYYGAAAYDFTERSLNSAAFQVASRLHRYDDALALLQLNAAQYPNSSGMSVFRGNILLMRGDTTGAAASFREAVRLDPSNDEARGRLRAIGQQP